MKKIKNKKLFLSLSIFVFIAHSVLAMSSTNYRIDSDVIGAFGNLSSSTNYVLGDTGAEEGIGRYSSTNYTASIGFWQFEEADATMSVNCDESVTLGTIIGTGRSDLTNNAFSCVIATNNPNGYKLQWQATGETMNSGSDTIAAFTSVSGNPEAWSVDASQSEWGARLAKTGTTTYDATKWGAAATGDSYTASDVYWFKVDHAAGYEIIRRNTATAVGGDTEKILLGTEIGSNKMQPSGTYSVGVVLTATTL
jgi:hypothetical protein